MLKRIKIKGYKSLCDIDVELQPLTVLFGPNAAGKSNFLDALQLLSRFVTCPTLRDAFNLSFRGSPLESFSFPPEGLDDLRSRDSISFSIEVDFTLTDFVVDSVHRQIGGFRQSSEHGTPEAATVDRGILKERYLRYHIEIEMLPSFATLRIEDEYLVALDDKGESLSGKGWFKYDFLTTKEKYESSRDVAMREEPNVGMHRTVGLNHSVLSQSYDPRYYPYLAAAKQEIASWRFFYFEPRERMRIPDPVKPAWHIGPMGEELPSYLHTLKTDNPRQFKSLEKSLRLMLPRVEGIETYLDDRGDIELKIKEDGVAISVRALSDGTLRMLALLALVGNKEPPSLIGLEEPENGIHPCRIEFVARLLETQARMKQTHYIVTTHSPTLVDCLPKESLFVVTKGDEGTRIEPFSAFGSLGRWFSADLPSVDVDETADSEPLRVSERILRGDFNG